MTIEDYFKEATPAQRSAYQRIKKIVQEIVPDAEETISYGIATLTYKGKYLIYFSINKNHMSVHPVLGKIEATEGTKSTFQFTENEPVPEWVIKEIVTLRLEKIGK